MVGTKIKLSSCQMIESTLRGLIDIEVDHYVFEFYSLPNTSYCYYFEGSMYPSVCTASWKGLKNEFEAGEKAVILILLKDAFGNNISQSTEVSYLPDFNMSLLYENGSFASAVNISNMGWNEFDYMVFEFIVTKSGNFLLHVEGGNQTLSGSPLPLMVNPGCVLFVPIVSAHHVFS